MIQSLIMLAMKIAGIYDKKEGTKYYDELLGFDKELQNEELKDIPDDGRISYLHQRIMCITTILNNASFTKNP